MKKGGLIVFFILVSGLAKAQTGLSFYHLGSATFQNSQYNPAFIPNGKFMLGLPVLSGVNFHYNNKLSYRELISTSETGNPQIDLQKAFRNMGRNNFLSTQVNVNLLHAALRLKNNSTVSLFANERVEVDFLYPKSTMELLIKGNYVRLDQSIDVGKLRTNASHFREIGLGYTLYSSDLNLTVGAHLKYLQGFFNASTPGNQSATLTTNSDSYALRGNLTNATLRTAGFGYIDGGSGNLVSHLIASPNRGAAIDLGFHWEMNKYASISGSITDLGWISWKDDIKNYYIADTAFSYSGVDLKNTSGIISTVKDTLINKFKIKHNTDSYSTLIGPKLFTTYSYHINPHGNVVTTFSTRFIQGQFKTMLGVGYQHHLGNFLTASVNLTKLPQQFFNIGAAFAVKGGPAQLYVAVDQVATWDLTNFQSLDVRVGMNFIFNSRKQKTLTGNSASGSSSSAFEKTKEKGPGYSQSQSFMGSKVKVKGHEDIYSIIPLQRRRKIDEALLTPEER